MTASRTVWVNGGLALLLIGAATGAYLAIGDPATATATTTQTTTVRLGTVTATVTGSGNAASASAVGVSFATGGTLTAVYVKVGDTVKAGQVLARIDDANLSASLGTVKAQQAAAQAQYDQTAAGVTSQQREKDRLAVAAARLSVASAKTSLAGAKAQRSLDTTQLNAAVAQAVANLTAKTGTQAQVTQAKQQRASTLLKDNQQVTQAGQQVLSAQNQLSQQQVAAETDAANPTAAALAQARSSLTAASAQLTTAQTALDNAVLKAPQAGTVLSVAASVGQTVSAGTSSSTGSSNASSSSGSGASSSSSTSSSSTPSGFVVLANLSSLTVTANVAEADASSVKAGQAATVTFSATSTTVPGTVTAVSLQGTTSSNVVQYPVTVTLTDVPATVRLGATASVSITTGSKDDALVVRSSAVTTVGQNHTVTLLKNGVRSVVPVEIGLVGDSGTEIVSGVAADDVLVLPTTTATTTGNGFPRLGGGLGLGGGR